MKPSETTLGLSHTPGTFDLMTRRAVNEDELRLLEALRHDPNAAFIEGVFRPLVDRHVRRVLLGALADKDARFTFVGTVGGRGMNGRNRTVLLKDLRLFGNRFVLAGHLWLRYDRHWKCIEPFLQGCKVVLVAKSVEYTRANGGPPDYTLVLSKLTKLWLSGTQPASTRFTAPFMESPAS